MASTFSLTIFKTIIEYVAAARQASQRLCYSAYSSRIRTTQSKMLVDYGSKHIIIKQEMEWDHVNNAKYIILSKQHYVLY